MGMAKDYMQQVEQEEDESKLANFLGIQLDELAMLDYELMEAESAAGVPTGYYIEFNEGSCPKYILDKIMDYDGNPLWLEFQDYRKIWC